MAAMVRVKARIKSSDGWRDASILNVSSRGLMIHSACCSNPGGEVELRGGDQVIRARVMWRKGQRAGLRSDSVLPMLDIINMAEGGAGTLALEAARRAGRCTRSDRPASVRLGPVEPTSRTRLGALELPRSSSSASCRRALGLLADRLEAVQCRASRLTHWRRASVQAAWALAR